jgi:hypothetical protein
MKSLNRLNRCPMVSPNCFKHVIRRAFNGEECHPGNRREESVM